MFKWLSEMLSEQQEAEQTAARDRGQRLKEYQRLVPLALADKISKPDRLALVKLHEEFGVGGLVEMMRDLATRRDNLKLPTSETCTKDAATAVTKLDAFDAETERLKLEFETMLAAREAEGKANRDAHMKSHSEAFIAAESRENESRAIEQHHWRALGHRDPEEIKAEYRAQALAERRAAALRLQLRHHITMSAKERRGDSIEVYMRRGVQPAELQNREYLVSGDQESADASNLREAFVEMGQTGKRGLYLGEIGVEYGGVTSHKMSPELNTKNYIRWIRFENPVMQSMAPMDPDTFVIVPLPGQSRRRIKALVALWRTAHDEFKKDRPSAEARIQQDGEWTVHDYATPMME